MQASCRSERSLRRSDRTSEPSPLLQPQSYSEELLPGSTHAVSFLSRRNAIERKRKLGNDERTETKKRNISSETRKTLSRYSLAMGGMFQPLPSPPFSIRLREYPIDATSESNSEFAGRRLRLDAAGGARVDVESSSPNKVAGAVHHLDRAEVATRWGEGERRKAGHAHKEGVGEREGSKTQFLHLEFTVPE